MQKRVKNLTDAELIIEVMREKDEKSKTKSKTDVINVVINPFLMTLGWGRANRGINFSYVSFFFFNVLTIRR